MNCDQKNVTNKFGDKSNFRKPILVETFKKKHLVQIKNFFLQEKKIGTGRFFVTKLF